MTDDMSMGNTQDDFQLQLEIFRRKCLQMLDPDEINYPMEWFIKLPATQKWIYDHLFNKENVAIMPYAPYSYRILKKLMSILEAAMKDPEEDVSFLPMAYWVARFQTHFEIAWYQGLIRVYAYSRRYQTILQIALPKCSLENL